MPSVYKIITTLSEVKQLIKYCKQTKYASVDFEDSGHGQMSELCYPTLLGVSFQPGSAWVIPLGHFDSPFKDNWKEVLELFNVGVLQDPNITKVAWNAKYEYVWFKKLGCKIVGRYFDGMLAKYLLNEERPSDLKSMTAKYLPEFAGYEENYEGSKLPWDKRPLKGLSQYCAMDCDNTLRLYLFFERQLIKTGLYAFFRNMLMMATRVLGDSEFQGMPIDREYNENLMITYQTKISDSDRKLRTNKRIRRFEKGQQEARIEKLIDKVELEIEDWQEELKEAKKNKDQKAINSKTKGIKAREEKIDRYRAKDLRTKDELKCLEPVNFGSPAQMGELFFTSEYGFGFEIIKYTVDKKTKKETQNPSTDESVLEELANIDKSGFCKELLEYRGLTTLYGTFIKGINERMTTEDRVHGRYLIHGTVTGRLSSQDPNIQNIPRDTTSSDIKKQFIPPPGYLLLQLDYSQAELRVMAAQAGEKTMIKWFKEGKDIHIMSALKKYHVEDQYDRIKTILDKEDDNDPEFKIWKVRRKQAKTINFGIIYGQGANKLADSLGCSVEEARTFLKEFDKTFPKVASFVKKQYKLAHEQAYVENVFGRKRRLWNIDSDQKYLVAEAERQSVNAPIQGAASDYTLFSSILIWEQSLIRGIIPIDLAQAYTVHDSIGYWVRPDKIHEIVPKLRAICSNPETKEWFGFQIDDVVMKVDFEVSDKNWGALKTYNPKFDYTTLVN